MLKMIDHSDPLIASYSLHNFFKFHCTLDAQLLVRINEYICIIALGAYKTFIFMLRSPLYEGDI